MRKTYCDRCADETRAPCELSAGVTNGDKSWEICQNCWVSFEAWMATPDCDEPTEQE